MRLAACMGFGIDIIEPCGFPFDDRKMRRAGMDYIDAVDYTLHPSWESFHETYQNRRIVLLTTKTSENYLDFTFQPDDILMVGRESAGVPDSVHEALPHRITIPMRPPMRSLNVAIAASMVVGEALRQVRL